MFLFAGSNKEVMTDQSTDIDAAFNRGITRDTTEEEEEEKEDSNGEKKKKKKPESSPGPVTTASKVTLSGLLNALDGVGAQEGRIVSKQYLIYSIARTH